jgi:hypothetical protein
MRTLSFVLFVLSAAPAAAIDRSQIQVSDNSRIVARNLVPGANGAAVAEHLALAQEIYQKQLASLKERRDSLRSRSRILGATSYATFAVTTLGVGAAAIAARGDDHVTLERAGYGALGGLALGTLLEVFGYMQEEPASIDAKVRHLQGAYDTMLERLRVLGERAAQPGADARDAQSDMAATIEQFIGQAVSIDVKG